MKNYLFMPEKGRWVEIEAASAKDAYCAECCWYKPQTRIAVMDLQTKQTAIFTRELDNAGNLTEIKEVEL